MHYKVPLKTLGRRKERRYKRVNSRRRVTLSNKRLWVSQWTIIICYMESGVMTTSDRSEGSIFCQRGQITPWESISQTEMLKIPITVNHYLVCRLIIILYNIENQVHCISLQSNYIHIISSNANIYLAVLKLPIQFKCNYLELLQSLSEYKCHLPYHAYILCSITQVYILSIPDITIAHSFMKFTQSIGTYSYVMKLESTLMCH